MANVFIFKPQKELSAKLNLESFIRRCREELTVFGADLDWSAWRWPKATFSKLGANSRTVDIKDCLDSNFIDFAKAYFRYQQGHKPTKAQQELLALRVVEAAFCSKGIEPTILNLSISVLDVAAQIAAQHYTGAAYHCGREVARLAEFATRYGLTVQSCSNWKSPIKRQDDNNKTGVEGRRRRDEKLPSEDAVLGMADIFSTNPSSPKDIFVSCVFAMLMCAPSRISEVLELPENCEVELPDSKGVLRYGWRFYSKKGYEGNIKWIPSIMVPIAKEAVRRVRELTNESRRLASWCENNNSKFYRHDACPGLPDDYPLSYLDACSALGLKANDERHAKAVFANSKIPLDAGCITLDLIWPHVYKRIVAQKGWPYFNQEAGVRYSQALFCMNLNLLHESRGVSPVIPWAPDVNSFNNYLSTRPAVPGHISIFDKFDIKYADGSRVSVTSHQVRHLLSTFAERGGLGDDEIAAWAGRADQRQNRVYNHRTDEEMVAKTSSIMLQLQGQASNDLVHYEPVTVEEFEQYPRGASHVTPWGACVHDFVVSPCNKCLDCLNCSELVCIKGDVEKKSRIEAQLIEHEKQLAASEEAIAEGYAGSDRWHEHHKLSVARLQELVALLNNPELQDETILRLRNDSGFSPLRRALESRRSLGRQTPTDLMMLEELSSYKEVSNGKTSN